MLKKISIVFILLPFLLVSGGCTTSKKTASTAQFDGGIFKTADKGNTWQQRVTIPTTTGQPQRFSGADALWLTFDPSDPNTVYYAGIGQGLLYSLDGAGSWSLASGLGKASIRTVEVSPDDKCTVYVSINNTVKKTTDCLRSWQNAYYDNNPANAITAMAIDHYDSRIIYIGSALGDLIKSADSGQSWQTIKRLKARIVKLAINPADSRDIFVLTDKKGLFRTVDGGENWLDIIKPLKDNKLGVNVNDLAFVKEEPKTIFVSTPLGIIRSLDNGETWEKIAILPLENKAKINTIAVNPSNSKEIYYATYTTFHRSVDGGLNWSSLKLPTTRAGWKLLIDPEKPNILYMGVRAYQKK